MMYLKIAFATFVLFGLIYCIEYVIKQWDIVDAEIELGEIKKKGDVQ